MTPQRRCDADRLTRTFPGISSGNQIPYLRSIPTMPTRSLKRELACAWRFSVSSLMWRRSMPLVRSRKITLGEWLWDGLFERCSYWHSTFTLDPYNETRAARHRTAPHSHNLLARRTSYLQITSTHSIRFILNSMLNQSTRCRCSLTQNVKAMQALPPSVTQADKIPRDAM